MSAPEQTTWDERLAAVREVPVLRAELETLRRDNAFAEELAREMMMELEISAPEALRDIPRRLVARWSSR